MNILNPPPMPPNAAPWVVNKALGAAAVAEAWSTVWYTGLMAGALLGVVGLLALEYLVRRARGQ